MLQIIKNVLYLICSRSYGGIGRRDRLKIYFSQESFGSSPNTSTIKCRTNNKIDKKDLLNSKFIDKMLFVLFGEYGEVVNTADCGSVMQGFDPLYSPQMLV